MIYTGRDYQHEAVASTLKHIEAGSKGILLALATGTGKSVIAGMLATHMETMLFIVDREELAFQAKEKLESITQRRVALECGTEYKAFKTSPDAKFVVAMSQSLIRRLSAYGPNRFDYIMEDECFPAGTMVGGVPIETIKVGDQVESFNHESQAVEYRTVVRISSRETKQLVRVVLKNGHSFVCTKCHPFFASGEYIQAIDLNSSHVLFQVNSDVSQGKTIRNFVRGVQYSDSSIGGYTPTASSVQSEENWSDILFKGLHDGKCQEAEFRKDGENKQKREKVSRAMKGRQLSVRCGNGTGMTIPQTIMKEALLAMFPDLVEEYVIATKMKYPMPRSYAMDLSSVANKMCIEIDGQSHCPLERQEQDKRKDEFIRGIGWTMLRFSNKRVMENLEDCVQEVLSTISKSKETTTTS